MTRPWLMPISGPAAGIAVAVAAALPRIETARLILRAPALSDFDAYAEILCSERAVGIGGPYDQADAWTDFNQAIAGWLLRGTGLWTVQARTAKGPQDDVVGFVMIHHEYGDPELELGYLFRARAEGQGYAAEATAAARDHGFGTLQLDTLVSYIAPFNHRSQRLARRLGAQLDPTVVLDDDEPCDTYRYSNPGVSR